MYVTLPFHYWWCGIRIRRRFNAISLLLRVIWLKYGSKTSCLAAHIRHRLVGPYRKLRICSAVWSKAAVLALSCLSYDLAKLLERYGITAKLFADDAKVYIEISGADDVAKLQATLHLIAGWACK